MAKFRHGLQSFVFWPSSFAAAMAANLTRFHMKLGLKPETWPPFRRRLNEKFDRYEETAVQETCLAQNSQRPFT
jgi:hypothetical protein